VSFDFDDARRQGPPSLKEWLATFQAKTEEDRVLLCKAAANLQKNPIFVRVVNELEARAVAALAQVPLDALEEVRKSKIFLDAVRMIRRDVRAMAADVEFEEEKNLQGKK